MNVRVIAARRNREKESHEYEAKHGVLPFSR